jgi:hypothetical protein
MKIILRGHITDLFPHRERRWTGGTGPDAKFDEVVLGYYIVVNNHIRIFAGEQPDFAIGDPIRITVELDIGAPT